MGLYKWQKECLRAWEANGRRGIVHVVTGAGKTFLALAAIDRVRRLYPDLVVRIVVPTIPLARQWERELLHHPINADESVLSEFQYAGGVSGSFSPEAWRPGFFGGGGRDDPDRHVMIYIINSARDSLAGHVRRDLALKRHVLLICDECHHYQSRENRKIFSFLQDARPAGTKKKVIPFHGPGEAGFRGNTRAKPDPAMPAYEGYDNDFGDSHYFSLGLSATPFGTADDSILVRSLGKEIYRYGFDAAVREGIISPFTVCEVSASFFADELKEYALVSEKIRYLMGRLLDCYPKLKGLSEREFMKTVSAIAREADMDPEEPACAFLLLTFQRKEISTLAKARNACCLSVLERLSDKDRVLVFCERISQAEEITGQIRRRFGNICGIYHSEMNTEARTRVLGEFRENRIRVLVSCRCLDEGIDVPDANIGIVMSSTSVERQRIQRLGRVIRRSEGKAAACLYYIYIRESTDDAAYLHGLEECESFSLRYYPAEGVFSNDLYEYVARDIISSARERGYGKAQMEELRRCLSEGTVRADCLLSDQEQKRQMENAGGTHERNYWRVMRLVGAKCAPSVF